jgi:hypothetical protein
MKMQVQPAKAFNTVVVPSTLDAAPGMIYYLAK